MEVLLENYAKTINIEALTMIDMTKKKYIPTCIAYTRNCAMPPEAVAGHLLLPKRNWQKRSAA